MAWVLRPTTPYTTCAPASLQRSCPVDVRLFVEARLQLDQCDDLLAHLGSPAEGLHDRAVDGGSVQGLLDREHVRVRRGGFDELLDRRHERLVRVVHDDIGASQHLEDVGRRLTVLRQGRRRDGDPRLALQFGAVQAVQRVEPRDVERDRALVDLILLEVQLARQEFKHLGRRAGLDLEANTARAPATAQQDRLDLLQEVARLVLLHIQIGVAGDPEHVVRAHLHAGEQPIQVRGDHVFDRDEPLPVGQREEPRQQRGHLQPREPTTARGRIAHQTARLSDRLEM